jgi:hypothetical protein
MKLKRGELSFEFIIGIAFLAVFLTTLMAVFRFYLAQNPDQIENEDITVAYKLVLETFKADAKIADSAVLIENGVELFRDSKSLAIYQFLNGSLYRTETDGRGSILLSKLEKAGFKLHPELSNLVMITLLPIDRMQTPFFTSFALRGVECEN